MLLRVRREKYDLAERMGQAGRERAARCFSRAVFGDRLEAIVHDMVTEPSL